ncbi:TetR/AcrR family transcriptional regulator [Yinghuangia soli]|uniref:TetR/AcrR family transcriptional regulator n=1 Tax=Yinghuangia soli TaxID=2908204 RepID=A0AA41Q6I8_9ACTN|nr:helix-turn-helix domain-containing protein [Yinghuangia soli]MCF2532488.1 TetR/AcrR family transcriptional regulator [Yinghuangia soli]
MESKRPRGRDEVVAAVLGAAETLFAERGPSSVTLRDVAAAADVNLGLLHRHIGSKEELLRAVLERMTNEGGGRLAERPDLRSSVDALMQPVPGIFNHVHLISWLLLEGGDTGHGDPGFPGVEALVAKVAGPGDDGGARTTVLAMLSMIYGWQMFAPFLKEAAGVADLPEADLVARLTELAVSLADR